MTSPPSPAGIPVLLLKTRSQPHDPYEEYFSGLHGSTSIGGQPEHSNPAFAPEFVPVLEHRPNVANLDALADLLKGGRLEERYGGMIFTSQRAVEAWAEVAAKVDREQEGEAQEAIGSGVRNSASDHNDSSQSKPRALLDEDFPFPLYTVGPATSRALNTLVEESISRPSSQFARLNPVTYGEHTGNGDALAKYILHHYNTLHSQRLYTFWEAPRLPFTPLIGPPQGERMLKDDVRLGKKPLLFLVGEQRRDIIPNTLMDKHGILPPEERVQVDEVEVYVTATKDSFQDEFKRRLDVAETEHRDVVVVVVFSPQGCASMLRSLGYLDANDKVTEQGRSRWIDGDTGQQPPQPTQPRVIIATIGPTTRDHLKTEFNLEADVCAAKPSPQGVGDGIVEFLKTHDVR